MIGFICAPFTLAQGGQGAAARVLRDMIASNYPVSEDDPLLVLAFDSADANALAYWNNGNYGLPAGAPGALPWPGTVIQLDCDLSKSDSSIPATMTFATT
jgi:hypothetical protein